MSAKKLSGLNLGYLCKIQEHLWFMNKMADSLYYSTRDFRDIILAELAKLEYGLREHSVNAAAVAQVRSASVSASSSGSAQDSAKQVAEANARIDELEVHNAELEEAASAMSIAHQAEVKKLRKENVELQGLVKQNKRADELEAQLEEAQRQIRTLSQENIAQRNTLDLNDKYAAQDKKAYADLLEKYTVMETAYIESRNAKAKVESASASAPSPSPNPSPEPVEQKKEVKKVTKPVSASASAPSPAPIPEAEPEEEQEEEEEAEEEAQEEEEEGEEPVEFEYKGKTYYLSSDNDVYQDEEGEFVQVGTWNGKKIIFG